MENQETVEVLLIDDKNELSETIENFLRRQPGIRLLNSTDNIDDAIMILLPKQRAVILLGLRNGSWSDIGCLHQALPQVPIILMGLLDAARLSGFALSNGLDSYLNKSSLVADLIPAIQKLAHRKK
jgi:DNA-binding NarL/FixJ family response regulator